MVATASLADAVTVLGALRGEVPNLDAVELILPEAMALVAAHLGATPPVGGEGTGAYVVVELADHEDPTDALMAALADLPAVLDAAVTTEGPARERLVAFRDRITESINAAGIPLKLDVAVPVGALDELMTAVRAAVRTHGGRLVPFGHLAEGNVHVNILEPGDAERLTADVLRRGGVVGRHDLGRARGRRRQVPLAAPRAHPRRARRRGRREARPRPRRHPQPRRPDPTLTGRFPQLFGQTTTLGVSPNS